MNMHQAAERPTRSRKIGELPWTSITSFSSIRSRFCALPGRTRRDVDRASISCGTTRSALIACVTIWGRRPIPNGAACRSATCLERAAAESRAAALSTALSQSRRIAPWAGLPPSFRAAWRTARSADVYDDAAGRTWRSARTGGDGFSLGSDQGSENDPPRRRAAPAGRAQPLGALTALAACAARRNSREVRQCRGPALRHRTR